MNSMEGAVENRVCPSCANPVTENDYFCPHCGKKIREKPLSTSTLTQAGIYALSFFLPPFGLWPAFRYLRQSDTTRKTVGMVAVILTLVSLVLTALVTARFISAFNASVNSQLQQYTF